MRFAVAKLPTASVASTVTFAWTFLPLSSALPAFLRVFFVSFSFRVAVSPGPRSALAGLTLSFLTFVSFPSPLAVHASSHSSP